MMAMMAAACEKEIKVDIDAQEPKVVVCGENVSGQPMSFDITYSRPVFSTFYVRTGEDYFQHVTDATLTLGIEGGGTETATRNGGTYTFSHRPQSGEVLTLDIAVPGQQPLKATATVPYTPVVSNIDTTTTVYQYDYYSTTGLAVSFTLADRAASDDYYSVRVKCVDTSCHFFLDSVGNLVQQDTTINYHYIRFNCTDYLLVGSTEIDIDDPTAASTFSGSEMFFTDATINGTNHTIRLDIIDGYYYYDDYDYTPANAAHGRKDLDSIVNHTTFYLEVTAFSRDHYLYRQTLNSYTDDELLAFISEPVQIHSNIEGGIGIFGVSAKRMVFLCSSEDTYTYKHKAPRQ